MATNIFTGQKVVTTSGTPVQLATQSVESDQIVLLKAKAANTGYITVGDTSAHALNSGSGFFKLAAGQSIEIRCTNTNLIWIDATVNGEGIEYFVGASGGGASSTANGLSGAVASVTGFLNDLPFAQYVSSAVTLTANYFTNLYTTINGFLKVSMGDALSGEDPNANRMMIEHQYQYSRKTADGQVKGSGGFIHSVTVAPLTATPTAGLLTIYDSLNESGTVIHSEWIFATTPAHTVILDEIFTVGCYIGFDATLANVGVNLSYR